jgi:hypothetical protein
MRDDSIRITKPPLCASSVQILQSRFSNLVTPDMLGQNLFDDTFLPLGIATSHSIMIALESEAHES